MPRRRVKVRREIGNAMVGSGWGVGGLHREVVGKEGLVGRKGAF